MNTMNRQKNGVPSARIVQAIADHTRTKPTDLPTALADVIDPDALDQLFADRDTDGQVTFTYEGMTVTALSDGTVDIEDTNR